MPYSVTLTRGAIFANIADGTINQTSTMTLIGRDFANYGQFVDQDFIRLLESGAATANSRPTNALTGQLWYDLTNTQLKIATQGNIPNGASYTGNAIIWQGVMPARSANAPSAPSKGDQWMYVDSVANIAQLIVYNGDTTKTTFGNPGWQAIGPLTRQDTVNVAVINANVGNFTTNTGDGRIDVNDLYGNNADLTDSVYIGRFSNGANNSTAFLDVRGQGIYGNVNGVQARITQLGAYSGGLLNYIAVGNSANPGTLTQIAGNGITTSQGISAQGTSYLATVAGSTATFNTMGNTGTAINGIIQASSKYQPYVKGLGIQEAAFDASNNVIGNAALAVRGDIIVSFGNGFTGYSNVNLGQNPNTGTALNAVYAKTFFGNLQGALLGDLPAANITDIAIPSDGGIYVGDGNTATQSGNVRLDGGNGVGSFNNAIYIGRPAFNTGNGNVGIIHTWGTSTVPGGVGDILTFTNPTANVLYDFYRDVRIQGNLYVLGNTVETNVETLTTADKDITLSDNTVTANIVTGLTGAGMLLGNAANVGASNQLKFTGVVQSAGTSTPGYDAQRWVLNRSLNITSDYPAIGGSLGDLRATGNIFADGAVSNSSFNGAAVSNLYITGTGGYHTGLYRGAIGGMLHANGAVGNAVGTYYNSTVYPATDTAQALSTPLRDNGGNITANNFIGIATFARYADLAELYLADKPYAAGTLVTVGGDAEITECTNQDHPLGVISTNPAYLMNTALAGGIPVALRGRVPVRFTGAVHKGDKLGPSNMPGVCAKNSDNPIAIALHNAYAEPNTEGMVEAVIL